MPYILKKTNGQTLATVQDASVDNSTSLTFVGRNYSGYGQPIEQNFVYLLENSANTTAPIKPVQGQLWFNNAPNAQRLLVNYDGTSFRDLANVPYSASAPKNANTGDLWWDSLNSQIKVYDAIQGTWTASQPSGGAGSGWNFNRVPDSNFVERNAIESTLGGVSTVLFSSLDYVPDASANLTQYSHIKPGINLYGADAITGISASSTSSGYMLWGTAAHALRADELTISQTTTTSTYYLTFATATDGTQTLHTRSNLYYNPTTDVLNITAASALYADIAERYEADDVYEPGTVLVIGGDNEVTMSSQQADTSVAGIVSTSPAYMLNSEAGTDSTHPYIALKGRVPCKVSGPICKGDLLVTSTVPGHAQTIGPDDPPSAVLGRALADFNGVTGVIEVKV